MSMQDTKGLEGDSKKTQRVLCCMRARMEEAEAEELMETATPARAG